MSQARGRAAAVYASTLVGRTQPQRNARRQQNTPSVAERNRTGIVERLSTSTWPYRRDDRQATTRPQAYGADDSATAPRSA